MVKGELQLPAAPARAQLPGLEFLLPPPLPPPHFSHKQADFSLLASPSSRWHWPLAADFLPCKEGLRTRLRGKSGHRKREVEAAAQDAQGRHVRWAGLPDPAQIERSMAALAAAARRRSELQVSEPLCGRPGGHWSSGPCGGKWGPHDSDPRAFCPSARNPDLREVSGSVERLQATASASGSPAFRRGGLTCVLTNTRT